MRTLLVRCPSAFAAILLCFPTGVDARQPTGLTLGAAIQQAQVASPRREGTAAIARSTLAALDVAGRLPNPVVEVQAENWSPAARAQALPLDVMAVATQYVELGGKRSLRRGVAAADHEVAQTLLVTLERAIALDTARAYVRALRARALVETLTAHREGLATLVAGMSVRVEEGYSAEVDLLKFRTEAARNDGEIARARLELERSLAALAIVIGSPGPIAATALTEPPLPPLPRADAAAIAAAVARHPSVAAANAAHARSLRLTATERARRYPDLAVSAGYKRTAGMNTLVVGVGLSVPVFDRNDVAVARAIGVEHAAAADREAVVQQLSADSSSLLRAATDISARATTAASELLAPAAEVRDATLAAFREGSADVLKVIDAERVYTDVRRAAVDLRLDALLTTLEARFALGEEAIP